MVGKAQSLKTRISIVALSILSVLAQNHSFADDSVVLLVQPKKCVALRKGKKCYQKLNISFTAATSSDYCLHINEDKKPLTCWKNARDGKMNFVFNSDKNVRFLLYRGADELVAESVFTVAWVYGNRTRRRSTWRLF